VELWKCVTCYNVCWQTVPQPSTSSGKGSVSSSCTLQLADIYMYLNRVYNRSRLAICDVVLVNDLLIVDWYRHWQCCSRRNVIY